MRDVIDRDPTRVVHLAVRRMLPKTRLGSKMLKKLKIYTGPEHPHAAQKPQSMPATGY
jgi:large subunit ribosomal protein L13